MKINNDERIKKKKSKKKEKPKKESLNKISSYRPSRSLSEPNLIRYEKGYHYVKRYKLHNETKLLLL